MIEPAPHDESLLALRQELLAELGPVFFEAFAAHAWGRILVEIIHHGDDLLVSSIDVDDVIGPERDIERAMGSADVQSALPALARAVATLVVTHEIELDAVGGGTFLRFGEPEEGFGFLPGLVRAPSAGFEKRRDALPRATSVSGEEALRGSVPFGTFAPSSVTFTHAWANPTAPSDAAKRARRACDDFPDRSLWEISTPQFATDLPTAWALTRIVAESVGGVAVRHETDEGTLFGILPTS